MITFQPTFLVSEDYLNSNVTKKKNYQPGELLKYGGGTFCSTIPNQEPTFILVQLTIFPFTKQSSLLKWVVMHKYVKFFWETSTKNADKCSCNAKQTTNSDELDEGASFGGNLNDTGQKGRVRIQSGVKISKTFIVPLSLKQIQELGCQMRTRALAMSYSLWWKFT